ncbi:MAG: hypothetical protein OXQ28_03805 [Acidobacteriota bacterium]|nr:hypothetical protein [Acidobacteriota bacterium]
MNRAWWTDGGTARRRASAAALAATVLALGAGTGPSGFAGFSVAAGAAQPMAIMTTVACVEADERGAFHLVHATEPEPISDRLPPEPEPTAVLGEHRIRLIGTLDEFGVDRHVGRKVWAKGLLIEDETERRLNVVSITRLSPDCE